ncbi:metallophosphoesterase [Christensenellaceae bacterium OttesenSCG-928-L17]|nr:metallophosphoesterase [Christensenellaceae bacterium OttesenSCG-928-L17]
MNTTIRNNKRSIIIFTFVCMFLTGAYICFHLHRLMEHSSFLASLGSLWLFAGVLAGLLLLAALTKRGLLLGYFIYLGGIFAVLDVTQFVLRLFAQQSMLVHFFSGLGGAASPVVLAWFPSIYGRYNAKRVRVAHYHVPSVRFEKAGQSLRVVMFSDMHLGAGVDACDVDQIVSQVQAQNPDIILLCGDIFEEQTTSAEYAAALKAFRGLSAPKGVYYVPGNHEYVARRHDEKSMRMLEDDLLRAGIKTLRDKAQLIDGAFYLIGRDDKTCGARRPLNELLADVEQDLPVIMMGHRPLELKQAACAGVDVQFSGHTHAGQLLNLGKLGERLSKSEMMYGLRKDGNYHSIVSSGVGTWVFPMRLGSPSEIVVADIA